MKREELFMEILGDLDDKFVAEAVPGKLKDDAPENETESSAEAAVSEKPEDNVEISKRDLRVYYALRAVGIAAAAVLIVGGIVLLVRNWDKIAVKDPERPANITTEVTQTTPVTSEAPVADDRMLDTSMPANPFLLPEPSGYEGLESYTSRYKPEFAGFGSALVELVGADEFSAWVGEYEREKLYDMSGAEPPTILSFVQRFNIPKEKLLEAVGSYNQYEAEAGVLDVEDIEVIYSGNAVKIAERFAADHAVVCRGKAYSPMWLYEHTTEAYRAAGITPDLIAARIEQYEEEFTRSPEHRHMSDDAWNAFYAKLAGYAGITPAVTSDTSAPTAEEYPIPVTITLDCRRNYIDDEVRDFLVANADDIDAFRTLYLRGYDDPRAVPTMIDYPYGAAPAVENKFYLQDTSKLPFDDIAGMREWMDRIFDEGYNLAWQPTLTKTREIDGELIEPVFIQINGQLYRREGTGNTACEMDYRTAKVVEVSVDDVYDGGRIKDGVIWFACVGTENCHVGYEAFYGRITVTDGVMKLAELPGHSLTEYRGETTGEISDIWNDRATYKVENQLIDANERITNEVTVELPIENKVVGAEALKLFDDVFYGEWVMTDDAFLREWVMTDDGDDHTIMLTYRDDMFTFENWCYPEYIVEDDRFYYLSFIIGGVPDCYIVEKGEPEILYHASYNGGSEYIIHRDRAKYRRKNDFLLDRAIKAGDEISRFGLWKLMTEYNEALWMRFQEETGFRFPTCFESKAGFTDTDGREWTMSSTLSEPLQRVWFLGGNGTDTIMLGLRYHSAEEWDTYAANDYKLAYQPKEYYFALRITTDEEMNSSVEYFTMDEVYDLDETLTYSSNLPQ